MTRSLAPGRRQTPATALKFASNLLEAGLKTRRYLTF